MNSDLSATTSNHKIAVPSDLPAKGWTGERHHFHKPTEANPEPDLDEALVASARCGPTEQELSFSDILEKGRSISRLSTVVRVPWPVKVLSELENCSCCQPCQALCKIVDSPVVCDHALLPERIIDSHTTRDLRSTRSCYP